LSVYHAAIAGLDARNEAFRLSRAGFGMSDTARFAYNFTYRLNAIFGACTRSVDQGPVCLNPVTNRKYSSVNTAAASALSRMVRLQFPQRLGAFALNETRFVSGKHVNAAPSESIAAERALSRSDVTGQKEYDADY
jgi:hypothetical protein